MVRLSDHAALVIRLHELEFTQDFVLFGESLYWVQEKMFLQPREYNLVLCLEVPFPDETMDGELVVLGVHVPSLGVKGILMNHYSHTPEVPSVITRKLSEMGFYSRQAGQTGRHHHHQSDHCFS